MTKSKQDMLDEMKGFYGLIEGTVSSKTTKGFTLKITAVKSWRDSKAKAPETVRGKQLFITFGKQGPGQAVNPVQRDFILKRVKTGQNLGIAVHDNGDAGLSLLALSRSQHGLELWERKKNWPYNPVISWDEKEETIFCENGSLRVRPSHFGIIWFDIYSPADARWYFSKNNLDLTVMVGKKWNNTELDTIIPRVEVLAEGGEEARLRYNYIFPNGARFYVDVSMRKGEPEVFFRVHAKPGAKEIEGFQWNISNGQSEAVARLEFGEEKVLVRDLPLPFPGARVEVQKVLWYRNLKDVVFRFSGDETREPDPNNPWWMGRVLGLKQEATWGSPMRAGDWFALEARDQPWQPHWKVPKTIPWIEGLWFIRKPFLEGDSLTYRINNYQDFLKVGSTKDME